MSPQAVLRDIYTIEGIVAELIRVVKGKLNDNVIWIYDTGDVEPRGLKVAAIVLCLNYSRGQHNKPQDQKGSDYGYFT